MFQRLGRWIRQYLGVTSTGGGPSDAESAQATQKRILEEQIAHYNRSLAACAGLCDLLRQQITTLQKQEATMQAALRSPAQADRSGEDVGALSKRLHKLLVESADLREQLKQAETSYQQITAARDAAIAAARKKMAEWKELQPPAR